MLAVIESLVCLWICWHLIKRFGFVKFVVGGIILICSCWLISFLLFCLTN